MGRKRVDQAIIAKTEVLLDYIKDAFQTFSYREGDRSKVMTWAEILEPVIDYTIDGVLAYIRDVHSGTRTGPPDVAAVWSYSYREKNNAERPDQPEASRWEPKTCDNDRVDRLIDQKRDMLGITKEKPLPPADKDASRRKQIEAARHLLQKKDLPFAPDEEDLPK